MTRTQKMIDPASKLIVSLDTSSLKHAEEIAESMVGLVKWLKIGSQLFTSEGPIAVRLFKEKGFSVFLDLKFHDIPETVGKAAAVAVNIGADMFNVHASGGSDMMKKALNSSMERSNTLGVEAPTLIAVTVLTSMDQKNLYEIGVRNTPKIQVLELAMEANKIGLDGIVASPIEASMIRSNGAFPPGFKLITPGIRPSWFHQDDHKRTMSPKKAIECGSDFLVVGRPIITAENPGDAVRKMLEEITG